MEDAASRGPKSSEVKSRVRTASHAARDLVLIVLGVLLALAADSWRESRQTRAAELALLGAMRVALTTDRGALEQGVIGFERAEAANLRLQGHFADDLPYTSELDSLFGLVYWTGPSILLNVAPYETLKANGLQLVQSESLRLRITALYENTYGMVRQQVEFNSGVVFDVLRPYFLANFRDLTFGVRATPLDYESIREDPLFRNILSYRADFVRRAMMTPYEQAIGEIDLLLDALDGELSARSD